VDTLTQSFEDRLEEIDAYLELLDALDRQVRDRPPTIGGSAITVQQQKILYSSVYLQLYNLVEATITWCVDAVAEAASEAGRWHAGDLSVKLRREWVRAKAKTNEDLNQDNRLNSAVELCDHLVGALPVLAWPMARGTGGSWDDHAIENITERLGIALRVTPAVKAQIKPKIRDDKRPLELIKDLRNRLAHGSLSFGECGDGVTVFDLRDIKNRTVAYLREVLASFKSYIDSYEFLTPASRPIVGAPP